MLTRLRPQHLDALKALFSVVRADPSAKNFHPHGFSDDDARIIANYPGLDIYAAYFSPSEEIIAYGMLRGVDEGYDIPSLGIYLAPDARGRGVSRQVMDGLHLYARRDLGASKVRLKVYSDNLAALNLYKRVGYQFEVGDSQEMVGYFSLD